jgi:hypothetical protein
MKRFENVIATAKEEMKWDVCDAPYFILSTAAFLSSRCRRLHPSHSLSL